MNVLKKQLPKLHFLCGDFNKINKGLDYVRIEGTTAIATNGMCLLAIDLTKFIEEETMNLRDCYIPMSVWKILSGKDVEKFSFSLDGILIAGKYVQEHKIAYGGVSFPKNWKMAIPDALSPKEFQESVNKDCDGFMFKNLSQKVLSGLVSALDSNCVIKFHASSYMKAQRIDVHSIDHNPSLIGYGAIMPISLLGNNF
jgi:hypothetical protein